MSKITKRLMQSIDYERVAQQRIENYNTLRVALGGRELKYGKIPMIFPYESAEGLQLRKHLISNKVFVASYWPNVLEWVKPDDLEYSLTTCLIPLPIDQRYGKEDMERIIEIINNTGE